MTDRERLEDAHRIVMKSIENGWTLDDEIQYGSVKVLADAARAHLECMTVTDEDVEAGAAAQFGPGEWEGMADEDKDIWRDTSRMVLEAVAERRRG